MDREMDNFDRSLWGMVWIYVGKIMDNFSSHCYN